MVVPQNPSAYGPGVVFTLVVKPHGGDVEGAYYNRHHNATDGARGKRKAQWRIRANIVAEQCFFHAGERKTF